MKKIGLQEGSTPGPSHPLPKISRAPHFQKMVRPLFHSVQLPASECWGLGSSKIGAPIDFNWNNIDRDHNNLYGNRRVWKSKDKIMFRKENLSGDIIILSLFCCLKNIRKKKYKIWRFVICDHRMT